VFHPYGSSEGFNGGMSWIPARGFGVVLLTNGDEGQRVRNVRALEELRWWIIDRFLALPGPPPDASTPPASWGPYLGTFVSTRDPAVRFTFALDRDDRLTVAISPSPLTPLALTQGAIDAPYQGGPPFHHWTDELFLVGFHPDETGAIRYAGLYSSRVGEHLTERAP
jgi:hypothetical protein